MPVRKSTKKGEPLVVRLCKSDLRLLEALHEHCRISGHSKKRPWPHRSAGGFEYHEHTERVEALFGLGLTRAVAITFSAVPPANPAGWATWAVLGEREIHGQKVQTAEFGGYAQVHDYFGVAIGRTAAEAVAVLRQNIRTLVGNGFMFHNSRGDGVYYPCALLPKRKRIGKWLDLTYQIDPHTALTGDANHGFYYWGAGDANAGQPPDDHINYTPKSAARRRSLPLNGRGPCDVMREHHEMRRTPRKMSR